MVASNKNRWKRLGEEIDEARRVVVARNQVQNNLLRALKRLAEAGHCSPNVQGWLTASETHGKQVAIAIKPSSDAKDNWGRPAIQLKNLRHLHDGAVLSLMVTLAERAPKGIRAYTVQLEGRTKASSRAWYARVDLTEEPEGAGICAHPLLHCHVGATPDEAELSEQDQAVEQQAQSVRLFSPRVPMPWLAPWEVLEWLLATVEPRMEPPLE